MTHTKQRQPKPALRNPFLNEKGTGAVDAQSRADLLKTFSLEQCHAALRVPGLQKTVERKLHSRIRTLQESRPGSAYLLFYDTETTGFPDWDAPDDASTQPHLVQIAAIKVNALTREVIASIDLVVRPNGWAIPAEATAIHGISTSHAAEHGVSEEVAVTLLMMLAKGATRVAHNEVFDARIINIAAQRFLPPEARNFWLQGSAFCTCEAATPILKLPPSESMKAKNVGGYKKPNLTEAFKHFFGETVQNAHSAKADAEACMAVYWAIQDLLNGHAA